MKNIFLKSKAKSLQKTGGGDSQQNVHHLGVASEMPPRCLRSDSVSLVSRQSDLRTYSAESSCETFSVGQCSPHAFPFEAKSQLASSHQSDFFTRVWKYAAMILMVLTLGIGNVWGTTSTYNVDDLYTANSWSTGTSGTTGSSLNQTISNISYAFTNGSSNKTYVYNSTPKRIEFYSDGNTITISTTSSYKITDVEIVVAAGSNSPRWNDVTNGSATVAGSWKKGSSSFTPSSTNISADTYKFTPTTATAGNTLVFTIFKNGGGTNAYLRINSFTVTYESASTTPAAPAITAPASDPALQTITQGETKTFEVTATGYPTPSFKWYKNTSKSTSGAEEIEGATTNSYTTSATLAASADNYYFYCVATNASGTAQSPYFSLKVNELGADLTAHTPGTYESTGEGGYSADLITSSSRRYETYYFYTNNSKIYLSAGNKAYNADGHYNLIDGSSFAAGTEYKAGWVGISANTINTSITANTNQFNINSSTAYIKMRKEGENKVRLKVSGYDQFAFYGKNNSSSDATKQFSISIDGESKANPYPSSNSNAIFAFDINTDEHYIEVTTGGTTTSDCQFFAFSLRLPCTLTYDANGGTGTMANTTGSGTVTLRTNTYTKAGCTFQGWATSQANANAGTVAYADGATNYELSADATLYAVWKLNTPAISCENNVVTMTVPGSSTVYYTTDGSTTPTSGSTAYDPSNKPVIAATTTFKAIAILASHVSSDVTTKECVYVAPAPPSTKRIYMKCGSDWCNLEPKFFLRSWGAETHTVQMTQMTGCETDTYYGDIPAGNTGMLFTRQKNTTTEIIWEGDDFWGQSVDITIGDDNLFTCTGWNSENPAKGTFSAGTYVTPTYSVSYNKNGDGAGNDGAVTGNVPTDATAYSCGAEVTVAGKGDLALAGYSFNGWNTEANGTGTAKAAEATYEISANTTFYAQWLQEVPTSALVDGGWRFFPGQTITLTVTPTGGTSGFDYQWQQSNGSAWENIGTNAATYTKENCAVADARKYRCIVSKAGASVTSNEFKVHVFTLEGDYSGGSDWKVYNIAQTSGTVGTVAVDLDASSLFEFGIKDNYDNSWYRNTNFIVDNWTNEGFGQGSGNCRLFTGPEGYYTFTVDIAHVGDGTPYMEVSVAYPSVTHPAAGYAYFKKWNDWAGYYIHWWYNDGTDHPLTEWGSDVHITNETSICGTDYIYFPVIANYDQLKIKDAAGDASHYTGNLSSVGSSGKYFDFTNDNAWNAFPSYTITFNSNGGSDVAEQHVSCGGTASEPTAPTRLNYDFEGWQLAGADYNFATVVDDDITLDAVWTRKAVDGEESDVVLVSTSAAIGSTSPLTDVYYGNASWTYTGNAAIGTGGSMFGTPDSKKWVGFTIPANYTATVTADATSSSARHCVLVTEAERAGAAGDATFLFDITVNSSTTTATSASIEPGAYCVGSTSGGININSVIVHLTYLPTVKLKVNGVVTQTISITIGEKLGEIFASGTLPTPSLPTGYTFNGWKNEVGDAAVNDNTVISGSMVIYADVDAPASSDATLSALTVNGDAATVDPSDATQYTFTLPFGTFAAPTVVATPTDAKAVATVTANTLSGATIEVVPETGEGDKVTYTITYSIVASKDIQLVFKTGSTACVGSASTASQVLSNNAAVSTYINQITFTNVEGSGDDGKEGGSLDVGKKAGNMFTLSAKAGFAMKSMNFLAKIQDATCEYSINGGEWTTLTSTNREDNDCYAVFSNAEVHEFRLRSTGNEGVWIRNMQLTMIQACTAKTIAWVDEPVEYEVGKSGYVLAATANNGTPTYQSSDKDVIDVDGTTGAMTIKALGSVTLGSSVASGDGVIYCTGAAEINKDNVKTYYLVTFDAQNETAATEVKYYYGAAAIALPSPSYSGYAFQGWFDASSGGTQITEAITPSASRTVYAQWEAQCDGPMITTQSGSRSYFVGREAATLVGVASAAGGGELTYTWYSCDDAVRTNPVVLAGAPTPSTAVVGTQYYYFTVTEAGCDVVASSDVIVITVEEKDPVCIIKATPTTDTEATADGAYKGSAAFKSSGKKLSSKYDYVAVQLMEGKSFLATDRVVLNQTANLSSGDITKFYIFKEVPADEKLIVTVNNDSPVKGDNWFTMPAEMAGESSLYIGRVDSKCNPTVGYLAVYRVMMPELQAISINGRAGELDELAENTFNVTIPYEADLASLTVVPTIVRNAAHATTPEAVISHDGEWALGSNTYRVMDKDGDYTDYNIVLTRDVLKHTVSFNTHGGTAVASVEVVDGGYLAAAPTAPTKEDYIFQYWSEEADGAEVDVTTVQINDDKEFHAVWVSDGGIKLLNGTTVNTTNYITGVTASKVTISEVEYDCVAFAGTVGSSVAASNMKYPDRHVTYNATTTQTKVKLHLYNNSGNKRTIYVQGVIEGNTSTEDIVNLATIQLNGNEEKTTEYIEFNNAKNRSIYVFVSSDAGDIKILQEKIIESGSALKKMGDSGYALNMNKGRMFGAKDATISFEGMTYTLNGDYTPVSSEVLKVKSNSIVFEATAPTLMKVTTANNNTYYVTKGSAGTDNETAKTGVAEFDLTAGTWYITAGGSEVQFTNIAFEAPKCEQPTVVDMSDVELCEGVAFTELAVSASVSDEGTLHYAWYKVGEPDEAVGDDEATYTPEEDGEYYVIVTNRKDNFTDNSKTSNTISVAHFAAAVITTAPEDVTKEVGQEATLTVIASGKNCTYEWFTCDDAEGTNPVAFEPAETGTSLTVTVAAGEQYYKVVVSSDCGVPVSAVAKVAEWREVPQANVTGTITWDWTNSAWPAGKNISFRTQDGEMTLLANESSLVPCSDGENGFRADMLLGSGQHIWRTGGADKQCFQGNELKFHTTVAGKVTVWYRSTGSDKDITLNINGIAAGHHSTTTYTASETIVVPANSDVRITKTGETYVRINKIVFDTDLVPSEAEESFLGGYEREVNPEYYGTVCLPKAGVMTGALLFQVAYMDYKDDGVTPYKVYYDQVANGTMEAGVPYIFLAEQSTIGVYYTATAEETAKDHNGLHGTLVDMVDMSGTGIYMLYNNKVLHSTNSASSLPANRAYLQISEIPGYNNPGYKPQAPKYRRISTNFNGTNSATGIESISDEGLEMKGAQKMLINGKIYILRGEKMYDVTGKVVK